MKLLITAGPTREPIDRVRFISNRSSGRLGFALAAAGAAAGHDVTLLMGAGADWSAVNNLDNVEVVKFESTRDLQELMARLFPQCDVLIMAAAVSDYSPAGFTDGKLPRNEDGNITLALEPTPDLVAELAANKRNDQRVISFSLEQPDTLEQRAREKMKRKGVDATIANPLQTMEADEIEPVWMTAAGEIEKPGTMTKQAFAQWLMTRL